jgi:hypothetical protein
MRGGHPRRNVVGLEIAVDDALAGGGFVERCQSRVGLFLEDIPHQTIENEIPEDRLLVSVEGSSQRARNTTPQALLVLTDGNIDVRQEILKDLLLGGRETFEYFVW